MLMFTIITQIHDVNFNATTVVLIVLNLTIYVLLYYAMFMFKQTSLHDIAIVCIKKYILNVLQKYIFIGN